MSRAIIARSVELGNETINMRPESSMSSFHVAPGDHSSIFKESDAKENQNNKSSQEVII